MYRRPPAGLGPPDLSEALITEQRREIHQGTMARDPTGGVEVHGEASEWERMSDENMRSHSR
jgi:hypothetical protein